MLSEGTAAIDEWAKVTIWKFISLLQKCVCGERAVKLKDVKTNYSQLLLRLFRRIVEGNSADISKLISSPQNFFFKSNIKYISYPLVDRWERNNTFKIFSQATPSAAFLSFHQTLGFSPNFLFRERRELRWKVCGKGKEMNVHWPYLLKEIFSLLVSCRSLLYSWYKGHISAIVKKQDLNFKKDFKRSGLLIHKGTCQRLFKWPVI